MVNSFRTNLTNVAIEYTRHLKINLTKKTLTTALAQNPFYPSLYSLSKVFNEFNINNEAYNINAEDIYKFDPPFITFINTETQGEDFILVTKFTGSEINYLSGNSRAGSINTAVFLKDFKGIVFSAEKNNKSGEKNYKQNLAAEKKAHIKKTALITTSVFLLIFILGQFINSLAGPLIPAVLLTATKLCGLAITSLILIYHSNKDSGLLQNICTAGKQVNCDAVLNSNASKIFGITWAEAGFFYFAATIIFLLFPGIAFTAKLPWLSIANTLVAPYILFSIYYQWRVVKQWCPLCLTVQAILALELLWALFNFWTRKPFEFYETPIPLLSIAFSIALPLVIFYSLKPFIVKARSEEIYRPAYKRLLYNPAVFSSLHEQQVAIAETGDWKNVGITIGNPQAKNTITQVCNPYCGFCAKAHPMMEEIMKRNTDINLKMIFTARNTEADKGAKIVKHFLALASKGNLQQTEKGIQDWYMAAEKDYEAFAGKYPMNGELKLQEDKMEAMEKWCKSVDITHTPTVFFNGKRLPDSYTMDELKYILLQ
ncbi:MAG: vitamin K epoxide reductase family protein [Ferruginibacter sp.]